MIAIELIGIGFIGAVVAARAVVGNAVAIGIVIRFFAGLRRRHARQAGHDRVAAIDRTIFFAGIAEEIAAEIGAVLRTVGVVFGAITKQIAAGAAILGAELGIFVRIAIQVAAIAAVGGASLAVFTAAASAKEVAANRLSPGLRKGKEEESKQNEARDFSHARTKPGTLRFAVH